MAMGKSFPGIKRPDRDADYSLTSSAKFKNRLSLYCHSHVISHGIGFNQMQGHVYLVLLLKDNFRDTVG